MARFSVGQKVVALVDGSLSVNGVNTLQRIIKDNVYEILSVHECKLRNLNTYFVGTYYEKKVFSCQKCSFQEGTEIYYHEFAFAPIKEKQEEKTIYRVRIVEIDKVIHEEAKKILTHEN